MDTLATLEGHTGTVRTLLVTSQCLLSACTNGTIIVWERKGAGGAQHAQLHKIQAHETAVYSLVVSAGRLFSSSQDGTIRVWKHVEEDAVVPGAVAHPGSFGQLVPQTPSSV